MGDCIYLRLSHAYLRVANTSWSAINERIRCVVIYVKQKMDAHMCACMWENALISFKSKLILDVGYYVVWLQHELTEYLTFYYRLFERRQFFIVHSNLRSASRSLMNITSKIRDCKSKNDVLSYLGAWVCWRSLKWSLFIFVTTKKKHVNKSITCTLVLHVLSPCNRLYWWFPLSSLMPNPWTFIKLRIIRFLIVKLKVFITITYYSL